MSDDIDQEFIKDLEERFNDINAQAPKGPKVEGIHRALKKRQWVRTFTILTMAACFTLMFFAVEHLLTQSEKTEVAPSTPDIVVDEPQKKSPTIQKVINREYQRGYVISNDGNIYRKTFKIDASMMNVHDDESDQVLTIPVGMNNKVILEPLEFD